MAEGSWPNFELHSLLGCQSENSAEMSVSSLSLNMASDGSIWNDSLESNDSFGTGNDIPRLLDNRNVISSNFLPSCTPAERKSLEYEMVINNPHAVQWSLPTKTVVVRKSESGKVGFQFVKVKNYLLVHSVNRGSPAYDKLKQGDLILSVNGYHMDDQSNVSLLLDIKAQ
ncbi:uncharacterized protein LOC117103488 [Anneissia japonica]|uniref:uncharacterized protein LOC117103488 n=1 Tax=Anneissia japonica TaxID=1529436 RepID=UPI00142586A4|nr:uncharacterized protein LOC117103488 [Anneissia japonica]